MHSSNHHTHVAEYFNRIADDFDSYYEKPKNAFQRITNAFLRKPAIQKRLNLSFQALNHVHIHSILDIGCGSGVLAIPLAMSHHQVIGIDFSHTMIEIAKKKAKETGVQIDFHIADFMKDTMPEVDACVALGVLEYFKNPSDFIQKMLSLVPEKGIIVFDIPSLLNYHTPLRLPYLLWRHTRAYFYTPLKLRRMLAPFQKQLSNCSIFSYGAGFVVMLKK
ncbi:MAG TPA: hypothetical protein DCY48_03410 [Candidatus Magasanikbacteria bacterium]|nr:MAG: hypothetical protein A3I74_04150 [Candidatus Magasanikbacteria bacterium RIFCSPLOWO2_02_FULL_47_16]OGH79351.1 MAG: hypothetical protein A3C10_04690 [Candidatus Magasanikbacteria bacterium RIFCSPHIGHO2_02_FULL_48_18]OGH82884.1 MAG: hypothetical protein A3G08_02980 [Candidatus Magasanikbacteria bacterium RIFCSPLOWO2_12_FULL_47_9b]HAZ28791.1 hypothetical protein [Candidatus Magasanikbacteria bacterium]